MNNKNILTLYKAMYLFVFQGYHQKNKPMINDFLKYKHPRKPIMPLLSISVRKHDS